MITLNTKLKTLVVTGFLAATVGVGGLAATPPSAALAGSQVTSRITLSPDLLQPVGPLNSQVATISVRQYNK